MLQYGPNLQCELVAGGERLATPALGAREEPWARRVRQRVGLGVYCRDGGAKMPFVFPIRATLLKT